MVGDGMEIHIEAPDSCEIRVTGDLQVDAPALLDSDRKLSAASEDRELDLFAFMVLVDNRRHAKILRQVAAALAARSEDKAIAAAPKDSDNLPDDPPEAKSKRLSAVIHIWYARLFGYYLAARAAFAACTHVGFTVDASRKCGRNCMVGFLSTPHNVGAWAPPQVSRK